MTIPKEAVQATHSAICDESLEDHLDPEWPGRCVKALEAAAPHLLREAWDEGYAEGTLDQFQEPRNPYSPTQNQTQPVTEGPSEGADAVTGFPRAAYRKRRMG